WLNIELQHLDGEGLRRRPRRVTPLEPGWCEVEGRTLRNFASNDYLGLAADPRVLEAAACALDEAGAGARASALVAGRSEWHDRLERGLAAFEGTEAVLLFPTGFAANVGTIGALVGREDVVYCDRLNHASLVDGCRLSGARFRVYPHGDVAALNRELAKGGECRRRLIVTDSLFSMDGDAAPLTELAELAERHDAMLLVDEAHATGVFGTTGRGLTEAMAVDPSRLIKVGTLSKGVGAQGGFVAGPRLLIDWLYNTARTQMFSTALAPAACAAALAAIEIIRNEPMRREKLQALSDKLRTALAARGVGVAAGSIGPIVPVVVGNVRRVVEAGTRLEDEGHLVAAIRPPTVPAETARLRISLTSAHTREDVEALAAAVAGVLV
ncbi:MAG: 8-amino-7-oxononanoate synthase, partial [Planctomycetaceae bacterium]|nr:8-amino-7-oxononanoate synthase [Planctomycetaceae bacterium]